MPRRMLHTMIRVRDLQKSIEWYQRVLGMKLQRTADFPEEQFTLAFLGYGHEGEATVLELTYNYGEHNYTHGTGYGHICIGVDDVRAEIERFKALGSEYVPVDYVSDDNFMAFIKDPDGYSIELLNEQRMVSDALRSAKEQGLPKE